MTSAAEALRAPEFEALSDDAVIQRFAAVGESVGPLPRMFSGAGTWVIGGAAAAGLGYLGYAWGGWWGVVPGAFVGFLVGFLGALALSIETSIGADPALFLELKRRLLTLRHAQWIERLETLRAADPELRGWFVVAQDFGDPGVRLRYRLLTDAPGSLRVVSGPRQASQAVRADGSLPADAWTFAERTVEDDERARLDTLLTPEVLDPLEVEGVSGTLCLVVHLGEVVRPWEFTGNPDRPASAEWGFVQRLRQVAGARSPDVE